MSSMRAMYCSSMSAIHHIFFPPRLQVVVLKENPDCLASDVGDQLSLDGLFRDQAHGPAGVPLRRRAVHHSHDALALAAVQQRPGSRSWPVIQRPVQPLLLVTPANLTNGFRRQMQSTAH